MEIRGEMEVICFFCSWPRKGCVDKGQLLWDSITACPDLKSDSLDKRGRKDKTA